MIVTTAHDLHAALTRYDRDAVHGIIDTGRYQCHYEAIGDGPPLLFLHGLADQPRSFAMLMTRLADRFRCIGIHLANGHGDGCAYGAYRHHHHAEDLTVILDRLGLERVDIMGSSFGSTVTLSLLARFPDRARRVVLQGGFARRPLHWIERGLSRVTRYWPGLMGDIAIRRKVMEKFDKPQFRAADDAVYRFFLECSGATPIRAAARRALMLDKLDLRPLLPGITHPVLMIGGDCDGLVPRWAEAEVETGLPNARRVEFRDCGHYPQYTHPAAMAAEMERFLLQQCSQ